MISPELQREFRSWQGRQFYEARITLLRDRLNAENRARFEAMDYDDQCVIIGRLIERGAMI